MTAARVRVPGDKSLTQRALILSALAEGESRLSGLLHGGDAESTAAALRGLGVQIPPIPPDGSEIRIRGVGLRGLKQAQGPLDLGNSGTGTRLLLGVLAGSPLTATVTGDQSLRARPMGRVTDPLTAMGGRLRFLGEPDRLPIRVEGHRPLEPVDWPSPVASAQVKSAILLAGLVGGAFVLVTEPRRSRDHTERLFRSVGASVIEHAVPDGWRVELRDPPDAIAPLHFRVPGDISSAAFLIAFGALGGVGPEGLVVENVGLNPTRTAFLDVLRRMGVPLELEVTEEAVEPIGYVGVRPGPLQGARVAAEEIPRIIDELPLIAILGSQANGVTEIREAAELRAKESDRIDALVRNLRALGVTVEEHADGLSLEGAPGRPLRGVVDSFHDHRIAMAFGILSSLSSYEIDVSDKEMASVSFPGFWELLDQTSRSEGASE